MCFYVFYLSVSGVKFFLFFFAEKFCEYKKLLYFCTVKNERHLTRYLKVIKY